MSTPLRLVVFDVDGTLIDSQEFILAAMHRAFGGLGVALPSREQVLSIVGLSLENAIQVLIPGLAAVERARVTQLYKQAFFALREENGGEANAPLYAFTREALELLHGQDEVLLGVATGKARRGLDHVCSAHDLDRYFVTRQTADQHPSKPHPSMLIAALADTGVEAGNAVMVGDTTFDVEMGAAAGYYTIGVTWGYHAPQALMDAGADVLIDSFEDLQPALHRIWGIE